MKFALYAALLLMGAGSMAAIYIAARSYWGERSDFVRWPRSAITEHPEQTGIASLLEISFSGAAGLRLAAWYVPSQDRAAIVLVHGTNADRGSVLTEIKIFADAGFGVLALDLPGQGASEGRTLWGASERQAISAAIDWLIRREEIDPQRIGGFGLSMGGVIMIQAAVLDHRLRAVALAAAPSDVFLQTRISSNRWGVLSEIPAIWALRASGMAYDDMVPIKVVGEIAPRPIFVLGGDADTVVPEAMTRSLYQAAGEPKTLWIVHGAGHGGYAQIAPQEYSTRLIDFFRRSLMN
jgi:dipeptidyl aminopeptidase/acylaminoacyl peptidase